MPTKPKKGKRRVKAWIHVFALGELADGNEIEANIYTKNPVVPNPAKTHYVPVTISYALPSISKNKKK